MNIKARRILYLFFVVLFLIAAPPLILYTSGYRYDFKYKRIVETGSLVVRSYPEGANIYLNGEIVKHESPTIINTILPGEINLLVEKEGYIPFEKKIEIRAKVTSFEENIKLYPNYYPKIIINDKIIDYWWNKKQNKIAYATSGGQLRLFNTLNKKDVLIANFDDSSLVKFEWSPHDDQFFFGRTNKGVDEYFVLDANFLNRVADIREILQSEIQQVQWDPSIENTLYALSEGAIYRIPYIIKTSRNVYGGQADSFLIEDDRIIILEKKRVGKYDKYDVIWMSTSDMSITHLLTWDSASKNDLFIKTNSHRISILNKKAKQLAIIDPSVKNGLENNSQIILEATSAFWSNDGKTLIYSDGFGIYKRTFTTPLTITPEKNKSHLILRYSQPIEEITWAENESRLLYSVSNTVRSVEISNDKDPFVTTILNDKFDKIKIAPVAQTITLVDSEGNLLAYPLTIEENARPFFLRD